MSSRFNHLRRLREETRMNTLAQEHGYGTAAKMVAELYSNGWSLVELANTLRLTEHTLKRRMRDWGITIKPKGGPNNKRVWLTQALVEEIIRDGVPAVAARLGITTVRLNKRMHQWFKEKTTDDNLGKDPNAL